MSTHTQEEYRAHPAIAQSDVKLFMRSRTAFWHQKIHGVPAQKKPSPAMDFGTFVDHVLADGIAKTLGNYVVPPDDVLSKSGSRAGNKYKDWLKGVPAGSKVVTNAEHAQLCTIAGHLLNNIDRHAAAQWLLHDKTVSRNWHLRGFWPCPVTRLQRKCEIDVALGSTALVDIKTTRDLSPDAFARSVAGYGYHLQAATYCEYAEYATGRWPDYYIVSILNESPYSVAVYEIDKAWIESGRELNHKVMRQIGRCYERDEWVEHAGSIVLLKQPYAGHAQFLDILHEEIGENE